MGKRIQNLGSADYEFVDCSVLEQNIPENLIIRHTGSAALDLAYVSCGRFDGCLQKNVNLWDIAAGTILIKEAGGIVDNFELKEFSKISIKASNERISGDLNKKIKIF